MSWELEMGAKVLPDGRTRFRVWAPFFEELAVVFEDQRYPMVEVERDLYEVIAPVKGEYWYQVDKVDLRADPVSRWQPKGYMGPSGVVDPAAFTWSDSRWQRPQLKELIFYELHVGTFTAEGTFEAAIDRLPHLQAMGINAISLMPVAEFPGLRNWGYDGVFPYAPSSIYGGPNGLKKLVDACHRANIVVVLDVVYNHLGPEGNYLYQFGPYFTDRYKTPWGWAINYDGAGADSVRRYFIDNALYWLTEYHMDGLRLDAVHAIYDFGACHFLAQLKEEVGDLGYVIIESDLNDVRLLRPKEKGGYGVDAQWHDDFHHAVHTSITKSKHSYFVDFNPIADLKGAFEEGYVVNWRYSPYRQRHHGSNSKDRPGSQFVSFVQNHDQIANACLGDRLQIISSFGEQKIAAALSILSPYVPMLFMGEEWAAKTPFHFFCHFQDPELGDRVRAGRQEEIGANNELIDPQAESTFNASKLDWNGQSKEMMRYYADLIALRKQEPSLANCCKEECHVSYDAKQQWAVIYRGRDLAILCNFAKEGQNIPLEQIEGQWHTRLNSDDKKYGGTGETSHDNVNFVAAHAARVIKRSVC